MQLDSGTRLGPYEIVSRLGAGGMGEVWRAKDTRLDRSVAIKMLPASLANNSQLRLRFEREAKTISQLQHPHICTLFDVGSESGHDFLVMELIEGDTLAARLTRGPLPLDQVLRYGIQIADALARAHRLGIVHRDLKPGNIMIAAGGVKLLDFGLAKQASSAIVAPDAPTAVATPSNAPITTEGTILGTLQYMSPEQLEGIEADARTDIFAFGAVLYEMVTGKLAFQASSRTSLIAAIVDREPTPVSTLIPDAPQSLERLISICLRKQPDQRWQSIHDVKLELEAIAAGASGAMAAGRSPRAWMGWVAAALVAVIAGGGWWLHLRSDRARLDVRRFSFDPPPKTVFGLDQMPVVISPDGKRFLFGLYTSDTKGASLAIRSANSFEIQVLPDTQDSYDAFWSPDGRQIGFFKEARLSHMPAGGGAIQTIASAGDSRGASWGAGDTIVFAPSTAGPIVAIPASGGPTRPVTKLDPSRKEIGHWRPFFLPDGKHFLYTARSADPDLTAVFAGSVGSFDRKRILDRDTVAVYGDGYLLYVDGNDLYAQKFDAKDLEKIGEPVRVAKDVDLRRRLGAPAYSAASGTLAYATREAVKNIPIMRADRITGKRVELTNGGGSNVDLSPDTSHLASVRQDPVSGVNNIWSYDLVRMASNRVSFDTASDGPVWSHDGRSLVYVSTRNGNEALIRKAANGTGAEEVIYELSEALALKDGIFDIEPIEWSPDDRYLVVEVDSGPRHADLFTLDLSASRQLTPLIVTPFTDKSARFSNDGRWITYSSDESGTMQIYAQPFPSTGARWQVSVDGGESPRWRGDGGEIYFVNRDRSIVSVPVTVHGSDLAIGKPVTALDGASYDYEVTPDGNTFFIAMHTAAPASPMSVVTNWTSGLDSH